MAVSEMNIKDLADLTVDVVKSYVDNAIQPLLQRISDLESNTNLESLERRLKSIEEKPIPKAGIDAKEVSGLIEAAVSAIELPKPESVDYDRVKSEIAAAVSAIEIPQPENGRDGSSVTIDDIMPMIDETIKNVVSSIEIPCGERGEKGENGRDALDIEILPNINTEKSYPRGTFATHKGGLWRAFERTHEMRGWECIVTGMSDIEIDFDGERKAVIRIESSSGDIVKKEINIPALIGKGVWREGESYQKGDYVQLSGSLWRCKADTEARPTDNSEAWEVAVKRGGTGDSAYQIARKNGFAGSVTEWLDSLGKKPKVAV